ncbi:Hsp20/alpha crystallin family protein [Streptosporangium sp. NPDC049304]|uniref:Hsp20/alpha crystallin family protein n=1 Tax=Streptosporangium sp. NPDC049304 TaxID=3154830 RepID=UPI003445B48E
MRRTRGGHVHGVEPLAVLRRDPFGDMQDLFHQLGLLTRQTAEGEAERPWMPIAEIDEIDDAYLARLEMPGIAPEDVEISINGRELCVNGEVHTEEGRSNALRVRTGRFHFHTSLPSDVDQEGVEASMDEGILTLRIPKAMQGQGRRIEVRAGHSKGHSESGRSESGRSGGHSEGGRSGGRSEGGRRS